MEIFIKISVLYYIAIILFLASLTIRFFYKVFLPLILLKFFNENKKAKKVIFYKPISVIIAAHNEENNLRRNLIKVLEQDYADFEVILVDDGSIDNTREFINELKQNYTNLRYISLQYNIGKKAALTKAIELSKNEILVFTDADCYPASKYWLKYISQHFMDDKERIVLGFGDYKKEKGFLNCFIRLDTYYIAILYFHSAIIKQAFMGVGRNLAYTKSLWYKVKGFENHRHIISGDDDLFIKSASGMAEISIELNPQAKTISFPKTRWKDFINQKFRHVSTSDFYSLRNKLLTSGDILSTWMFYFTLILLSFYFSLPKILIILFCYYFIISVFNLIFSKRLNCKLNIFCIVLFDIFAMFFYVLIYILKKLKIKI